MSTDWGRRLAAAWSNWTAAPRDRWEEPVGEHDDSAPRPARWRPATQLGPGTPGRSGVPYYDDDPDDPDTAPMSYPAWLPGETVVVTGPVGPRGHGPGEHHATRADARRAARAKYGAVLEDLYSRGRWAVRVPVPGAAGAKHRPKERG